MDDSIAGLNRSLAESNRPWIEISNHPPCPAAYAPSSHLYHTATMFGFGSSSSTPSSSSSSSAPVAGAAPNREERAACWTNRDAYFTCLDQNGVIAAGDDKGPCQKEKKGYEGSCSRSWVSQQAAWILWGPD